MTQFNISIQQSDQLDLMKHAGKKLVCDVPQDVIDKLNNFWVSSTEYKNLSSLLSSYFFFYINMNDFLTPSNILIYEDLPGKNRNNFSFYLSVDNYTKLSLLAKSNLRSTKNQATHFVYSIYKYINETA